MLPSDTIAAIATAPGRAALAIVRVSGPDAVAIVDRCVGGRIARAESHTAHVVAVRHPEAGERLDEAVVTVFRAPRTATGEDVVEVTTHGGDLAPALVLDALVAAGARPAEPGEFTMRAFLNGKRDLTQAEAVADLIHASSRRAHRVAMHHLTGDYARHLGVLRDALVDTAALVELELDFGDEDVTFANRADLAALLDRTAATLDDLLASYRTGAVLRDGVAVALVGRPNAGKSTLLNALVGHERAIVSPTPGTTRDAIEAEAEIGGVRVRFVDTAGLRATDDAIEAEGVRRADAHARRADVLVYAADLTRGDLEADERAWLAAFRAEHPDTPVVVAATKRDLAPDAPLPFIEGTTLVPVAAAVPDDAGVQGLGRGIVDLVAGTERDERPVVTNARHRHHLGVAREAVERAREGLATLPGDLLALDLRIALDAIGEITGAVTRDDVLGAIFGRFCIGK